MLMLNAQIFYYCALMALLKCSKGASIPPLHLFFCGGTAPPPHFWRIVYKFLLFYHGQLIRTYKHYFK